MLGPVQVDFLRPTIQRALAEQLKGFTVDFEHTVLVWGGWSRAIDVRVTNVVMKDRHDLPVIELPQLAALDLDHLRADLVDSGVDRRIDIVAKLVQGGELAIAFQVALEVLT